MEIMTLSPRHERSKHLLRRLIEALAEEMGLEIAGFGSMTFKRWRKKRGLEPDECFWIQNEALVRDKDIIDFEKDPPPDLVLEVDIASSSMNRMSIYTALGVPEVWRFHAHKLEVHVLGADGSYLVQELSRAFPFLRPAELLRFLELRKTQGEMGMLRAFREWVRAQIASGWPNPPATPQQADPTN
jgi:Uma2 family endonuclease